MNIETKLTLLMPFSRINSIHFYISLLKSINFKAILIIDNQEILEKLPQLPEYMEILFTENQPVKTDVVFWKINQAIEKKVKDNVYYSVLMDDDSISKSMQNIKPKKNITIVSMKRGYRTPAVSNPLKAHPAHTLYAHPSNMKIGQIGAEQIILKGDLLKNLRFNEKSHTADGEMAEYLYKVYPDIDYQPHRYILFNYLEKGRYE